MHSRPKTILIFFFMTKTGSADPWNIRLIWYGLKGSSTVWNALISSSKSVNVQNKTCLSPAPKVFVFSTERVWFKQWTISSSKSVNVQNKTCLSPAPKVFVFSTERVWFKRWTHWSAVWHHIRLEILQKGTEIMAKVSEKNFIPARDEPVKSLEGIFP